MEVTVTVGSKIHVSKKGLPEDAAQAIRQAWIFPNPLFDRHKRLVEGEMEEQQKAEEEGRSFRMRFAFRVTPSESISAFEEDDHWIALPRGGGLGRLEAILNGFGHTMLVQDARCPGDPIDVELSEGWSPRDYQVAAADAAYRAQRGFIEAGTGSGKTVTGLMLIALVKRVALVIAHTSDILDGWMKEIAGDAERHTVAKLRGSFKVTRIQGVAGALEAARTGDIILATVQTLHRCPQEVWDALNKRVGLTLGDESHHTPATTFWHVFSSTESKRRNGLTATPKRKDALDFLLHEVIGPKVFHVDEDMLVRDGAIVNPEVEFVSSSFYPTVMTRINGEDVPNVQRSREIADTSYNRIELISRMVKDEARNRLIVSKVVEDWKAGHLIAVLTERVEHAELLADLLQQQGMVAVVRKGGDGNSEIAKKRRREIMVGMASGKIDVLVGTSVLDEGTDIPTLSSLHLTCPSNNEGLLKQRVGRIRRPKGKQPKVVRDYVDFRCKAVRKSYLQRQKWYRKWNWRTSKLNVFGALI